jgi:micrococcal nuclease
VRHCVDWFGSWGVRPVLQSVGEGQKLVHGVRLEVRHTAWLSLIATALALVLACTPGTPATPTPLTVEVGPFEPTLVISDCSTTICCSNCPAIPVHRIIDGDTFVSANATIRLFGVNTPERGEDCYDEATQRLRELAGDSVRVQFGPRQEDQYGRILYYVYNLEGESIDEMLVREGLALAWTRDGQHRDVLVAVEEGAKEAEVGCLESGSESPVPAGDCDPSYPDVCIPSPPPDLDCGEIREDYGYENFEVLDEDPHRLDGNRDGVGCES